MIRRNSRAAGLILLSMVPLAALLGGCPQPAPPPEAVLQGTWLVTVAQNPDLKTLLVTFDENGNVTEVQYKLGDNALITVTSPTGVATVDGQNVVISATFNDNGLTFNGTLNGDNTVITGNLTTQIVVGGVIVTVNNGPATLTKQ